MLNAPAYVAEGAGPHPTVVLLHGFPGNEKNLYLAQAAIAYVRDTANAKKLRADPGFIVLGTIWAALWHAMLARRIKE